jgi:hypothetical protein
VASVKTSDQDDRPLSRGSKIDVVVPDGIVCQNFQPVAARIVRINEIAQGDDRGVGLAESSRSTDGAGVA